MNKFYKGIIFFFLLTISIFSESFKKNSYKFYKNLELNKNSKETNETIYGVIKIDDEINTNSNYTDIRISHKGKLVPFIRRSIKKTDSDKSGKVIPKIIFQEKNIDYASCTLEIPKIPKNTHLVSLKIISNKPFDQSITIYKGDDPQNLSDTEYKRIFKYDNPKKDYSFNLEFDRPDKFKYIKIEFGPTDYNFSFSSLEKKHQKSIKESSQTIDLKQIKSY
ncbi:MAG: hypothetical protein KDK36_15715, partial [Leptospiraceae bacterium]|nr:hypothetical protein [Leptospiraceae bacterium]